MSSKTALPGCMNCALARLLVCTLTSTALAAIVSSCSRKGVDALNSTTRTCGVCERVCVSVCECAGGEGGGSPLCQSWASNRAALLDVQYAAGSSATALHAHLAKLCQQRQQRRLVHHAPVGALALEGDHAGQWRAHGRGGQPILQGRQAGRERRSADLTAA